MQLLTEVCIPKQKRACIDMKITNIPKLNPQERSQTAQENFLKGYNCSQSILMAFSDLLPLEPAMLEKLGSSFGGGMGRLREVCGSVSGIFMVFGMLYGYEGPQKGPEKMQHYTHIQALAEEFKAKFGSIVCRELLNKPQSAENPKPDERTDEYYKKRPCKELIGAAAEILSMHINKFTEEKLSEN